MRRVLRMSREVLWEDRYSLMTTSLFGNLCYTAWRHWTEAPKDVLVPFVIGSILSVLPFYFCRPRTHKGK